MVEVRNRASKIPSAAEGSKQLIALLMHTDNCLRKIVNRPLERSETAPGSNRMALLNDKEIMSLKDVEKLARIAGSTLSDVVKKHVKENHMFSLV